MRWHVGETICCGASTHGRQLVCHSYKGPAAAVTEAISVQAANFTTSGALVICAAFPPLLQWGSMALPARVLLPTDPHERSCRCCAHHQQESECYNAQWHENLVSTLIQQPMCCCDAGAGAAHRCCRLMDVGILSRWLKRRAKHLRKAGDQPGKPSVICQPKRAGSACQCSPPAAVVQCW